MKTRHRASGFTLTELVAVIVIAAILGVMATSFFSRRTFDAIAFADQTLAQLAYAQKVAVAARRTVTVTIASNTVSLSMCTDFACSGTTPVPSPTGEASFTRTAPSGVTITPASFAFTPLGATNLGSNLSLLVAGDVTRTITVEATTGYVRR